MIKKFLHCGMSVKDLDKAVSQYKKLGFKVTKEFEREELKGRAAMLEHPDAGGIELWQWQDRSIPQIEFIEHHLAFLSDNVEEDVRELVANGCEVVIPRTVGAVFIYSYVRDPNGTYLEIASPKPV